MGRGRLRKTWKETLRKDMEYLELTEDLAQNRKQWRPRIHRVGPPLVGQGFLVVLIMVEVKGLNDRS